MTCWTLSIRFRTRPFFDDDSNDVAKSTTLYLCTTKCYKALLPTTPYYKVLLRYYSILQEYYSSTFRYQKVLQSSTPVLQSIYTPVVFSATLYDKVLPRTSPCYKVLQSTTLYFKVLQSTTPVLQLYYKGLQSITPYILQSTTKCYSSTPKYYKVLLRTTQYRKELQSIAKCCPVLDRLIVATHETSSTLRRATSRMQKAQWNFDIHVWQSQRHEMSIASREAPGVTLHHHQIPCLPRKRLSWLILVTYETSFPMRGQQESPSNFTKYCACHKKWLSWLVLFTHEMLFTRCGARSNRSLPPTSPKTAPATKNDSHDCSSSHMKCYLQGVEQQEPPSNLTKYCACHKRMTVMIHCPTSPNTVPATKNDKPSMIRAWTRQSATRRATEVTFRPYQAHVVWENTTCRARAIIPNFTNTASATTSDSWTSPNSAPATKSDSWTSPNIAPATTNDSWTSVELHQIARLPRQVRVELHQRRRLPRKVTVYDPGLRFPTPPTPPNVMTLSTLPIAPMTIWRPPCCFEGELAEIEYRITSGHVWSLEYLFMP